MLVVGAHSSDLETTDRATKEALCICDDIYCCQKKMRGVLSFIHGSSFVLHMDDILLLVTKGDHREKPSGNSKIKTHCTPVIIAKNQALVKHKLDGNSDTIY